MAVAKTNYEYHNEVKSINPNIIIEGFYQNGLSKMKCTCKKCGYEWTSNARNLVNPKKCLNCMRVERIFEYPYITDEEFKNTIKNNYPNIIVRGTYTIGLKTITCECKDCGYISRIRTQQLLQSTYKCSICENGHENIKYGENDIKTVNPVLYDCLADKSDADKYTINSRAKIDFICSSCGKLIKNKTIDKVNRLGLKCKCQDGNSLGEKYFYQVIKSVDENVLDEQYLGDNLSYRYDFLGEVNNIKWICEIMGKQHYGKTFETCGGRTLEEEKENDLLKENFALSNGIDKYIKIDSKESGLHQLKNAILKSEIANLYDLSNVDWVRCYRDSLISEVKIVCELWNKSYRITDICNLTKHDKGTVRRYLMRGNSVGLCNYDNTIGGKVSVKCVDTGEIFSCLRDAENKYGIKRGYLSSYLKGVKLPVANKTWEYLESTTS